MLLKCCYCKHRYVEVINVSSNFKKVEEEEEERKDNKREEQ